MESVHVLGLHGDPASSTMILFLGDPEEPTRVLPIFIGPTEARAIVLGLSDLEVPRPGTHDLLAHVIHECDAQLDRVAVTELVDGTFHAILELTTPAGSRSVSARPSDAIALAIRVDAPVVVAEDVLEEAAVEIRHAPDEPFDEEEIEEIVSQFESALATATVSDFMPEPESPEASEATEDSDDDQPPGDAPGED